MSTKVGTTMKIRVRNSKYPKRDRYFFAIPEFVEYEGEETTLKHIDSNAYLCLTTGLKDFPVRVIDRSMIVGKRIDFSHLLKLPIPETKVVKGSKGQEYVLTKTNAKWSCTCPGFEYRKDCKHVRAA